MRQRGEDPQKYKVDYLRVKIPPNTEGSRVNVVFKNVYTAFTWLKYLLPLSAAFTSWGIQCPYLKIWCNKYSFYMSHANVVSDTKCWG